MHFLRAVTHARAAGEAAQTAKIQEQGDGGQTIEERIEETFNEKTGVRHIVTVKRLTAPDWRARFALLNRQDKLNARRNQAAPTGEALGLAPAHSGEVPGLPSSTALHH